MTESSSLALYLVFDQPLKLDSQKIQKSLSTRDGNSRFRLLPGQKQAKPAEVRVEAQSNEGTIIELKFDEHTIRLVGINAPIPSNVIETPINVAHLQPGHKTQLRGHKAQVIAYYEGKASEMVERFIALYQAAWACAGQGLIGVINPQTWMCLVTPMLEQTVQPDFLNAFRSSPASSLALWMGYVKFTRPDNKVWFATRGAPLFGIPEFAFLGDLQEGEDAYGMFGTLISYVYDTKARLAAGHTIQLAGDIYLRFAPLTEYRDEIGHDTLVLQRIKPNEINQR